MSKILQLVAKRQRMHPPQASDRIASGAAHWPTVIALITGMGEAAGVVEIESSPKLDVVTRAKDYLPDPLPFSTVVCDSAAIAS